MSRVGGSRRRRGPYEPQPLSESLAVIATRMGAARVERFEEVCAQWPSIVGVLWAEHSRPVSISHGTLRIFVSDPALAEQFRWARRDLIGAVNGILGEPLVTELHTAFD